DAALGGKVAQGTYDTYRGQPMITTAVPLSFLGHNWALVSVNAEREALAQIDGIRNLMLEIGLGLLLVITAAGVLFARSITKPMTRLTHTMAALSNGSTADEGRGTQRRDELGAMARAVEVFKHNAVKVGELTEGERVASQKRR